MVNSKVKGISTKRLNLTVYPRDLDIIETERKKFKKNKLIFNTSDFFRFCLNNQEFIDKFVQYNFKKIELQYKEYNILNEK